MEAKYISPLTDFGFKKLFGEEANKALLINFLNDLLPIQAKIVDLSFKKNQQLGDDLRSRSAVYDIFCQDEKNQQFIVEMQNARQIYYRDRAVFYSTFPIRDQGEKGDWNFKLQPVYCVGLLGFCLDDRPSADEKVLQEYIHTVQLKDQNNKVFYQKLTYFFVELPQFQKKESELKTHFEKWLYFLKNLESFDRIPAILNEEIFQQAFKVAELAQYTPEQRMAYESSLKSFRDNINVITTARIEGEETGLAQGLAKGRAEGRAEGKAEVAKNLCKAGASVETIMEVTGFTREEIERWQIS
jgi:predicted transposase/invertase (TIGR01784 family)